MRIQINYQQSQLIVFVKDKKNTQGIERQGRNHWHNNTDEVSTITTKDIPLGIIINFGTVTLDVSDIYPSNELL